MIGSRAVVDQVQLVPSDVETIIDQNWCVFFLQKTAAYMAGARNFFVLVFGALSHI